MNRPLELSIEKENEDDDDCLTRNPIRIVRLGDRIIEVSILNDEGNFAVKRWFQERDREKRRSPLVAGLSFFRGSPERCSWDKSSPYSSSKVIAGIALCLGGSHCLFIDNSSSYDRVTTARALRDFLNDRRVTIVGVGFKKAVESFDKDWGIHLGKTVEARTLMEDAYGMCKMMGRTGLEEMAEIALNGMRVRRLPMTTEKKYWFDDIDEDRVLQATFDAFLCFEIGVKCLQMLGRPT
ncbi:Ribonuclease H-like protein [Dioscorea alata]|uniref:Ribonuclease H-like protein n=1 Tax=Dioscorea alata TaxID=55571 RepID=A0ACB7WFH6_DIOAL|nr:Ribonuclease H-like protein [Dioscorea alata]